LGAQVRVPTLAAAVKLDIPPGTPSGKCFRLARRGLGQGRQGNQYVTIEIQAPAAETPEQRALYNSMADMFEFEPRAGLFEPTVQNG